MKIIFFDVETTGKIKDWSLPMTEVDNFPRVIQIAFLTADETGKVLSSYCSLVTPDNWIVPIEDFWTIHGFCTEKNITEGKPMPEILDDFLKEYNNCDILSAHNLAFDFPTLGAEIIRYDKGGVNNPARQKICTMEAGTDFCKIPFGNDRRPWKNKEWKFPKLSELYKKLFDKEMESAHNALVDVTATKECFFQLVKLGIINLQKL